MKKVAPNSTCYDKNEESTKGANDENGSEPPQKKKRLSNREYKKLKKGQNKVS